MPNNQKTNLLYALTGHEPTSGLDYRSMCQVSTLLRQLAESGRIVIVVSHDGEFMRLTCDCEIHLPKGGLYERK